MKLKYYIGFSILFAAFLGVYINSLEFENYTYEVPFMSYSITLSVALWIIGIVGVFFVATLVFFASMWASDLLENYHRRNDYNKLLSQINEQALNQPLKSRVYKRKAFGDLSKILQRFYLKPRLDSAESFNRKVDKLFEDYKDVMVGKVVDLKSYQLSEDNKFNIQNLKNKITNNYKFAFQVLNGQYNDELKRFALCEILKHADKKESQKVLSELPNISFDKTLANEIFALCLKYPNSLEIGDMVNVFKSANFDAMDYIQCVRISKGVFAPDEWMRFFESCADNDENAEMSFFYVLFELEMIDKAKERHKQHSKGEHQLIDAYLELKRNGKHYPFDIFLLP